VMFEGCLSGNSLHQLPQQRLFFLRQAEQ
jgi:hypothetical protein